ncbi:MAG: hypothetical protein WCP34_03145 [Pseudomonadota bacterium]
MSQDPISLLDLEDKIQSDAHGTLRRQWIEELDQYGRTLQRQLDAGLAPADFRAVSAWRESVATASEVLNRIWAKFHPNLHPNH